MRNYTYEAIASINGIDNNKDLMEVWNVLKTKYDKNLEKELNSFYIGEDLQVVMKSGVLYDARVEKINKKTIKIVLTDEEYKNRFVTYNVHPKHLRREEM